MNTQDTTGHVKVLFEYDGEGGSVELESLWTLPCGDNYRVDNIPFYVKSVGYGDVVTATPDQDGMLRFEGIVTESGHSTIRLWFERQEDVPSVREKLDCMGCGSELNIKRLVAVDVPPDVDYSVVREYLEECEKAGLLEYEEGCLAQ